MRQTWLNWLLKPATHLQPPVDHERPGLEARLERVEAELRELRMIPLAWQEVLDKLQAFTNRQNARDHKRLTVGLDKLAESREDAPGAPNGEELPTDPLALKIALRRRLQAQNQGGVR